MHNIEYIDDSKTISEKYNEGRIQTDNFKEDILQNMERKYKNQIVNLKFQIENERQNSRNITMINKKRNIKMNRIIDILSDCLEELQNDKKDADITVNNSVI